MKKITLLSLCILLSFQLTKPSFNQMSRLQRYALRAVTLSKLAKHKVTKAWNHETVQKVVTSKPAQMIVNNPYKTIFAVTAVLDTPPIYQAYKDSQEIPNKDALQKIQHPASAFTFNFDSTKEIPEQVSENLIKIIKTCNIPGNYIFEINPDEVEKDNVSIQYKTYEEDKIVRITFGKRMYRFLTNLSDKREGATTHISLSNDKGETIVLEGYNGKIVENTLWHELGHLFFKHSYIKQSLYNSGQLRNYLLTTTGCISVFKENFNFFLIKYTTAQVLSLFGQSQQFSFIDQLHEKQADNFACVMADYSSLKELQKTFIFYKTNADLTQYSTIDRLKRFYYDHLSTHPSYTSRIAVFEKALQEKKDTAYAPYQEHMAARTLIERSLLK